MIKTRNTPQRLRILEHLRSVKTHPTAEMIYQEVVKDIPTITLATVYRNLNLLADRGEILKLEINGEYHFDADMCYHQHCVCKKCGKIIDVFKKDISAYAIKKMVSKEFTPDCVTVIFHGVCKKCKRRKS